MTGPGASDGSQQPEASGPAVPDPAGCPRAEQARESLDPACGSPGQAPEEDVIVIGPAEDAGANVIRVEVPADFQARPFGDLIQRQLADIANAAAQAREAVLAASVLKASITPAFQAAAAMQALPDPGFFRAVLPAAPLIASLPAPVIAPHLLPAPVDLGFTRAISAMTSSWDHGLLRVGQQLAEATAVLMAPHQVLIRDLAAGIAASMAGAFRPVADLVAASATAGLADLFRSWRELAESGSGLLRGLARAAHTAALRARAAVCVGEEDPVAWFIEEWLDLRANPERIAAVSAALLEDGWDSGVPADPRALLVDLRRRSRRQARVLRPIWENKIGYRHIGMLDQPVPSASGMSLPLADLVPDPQTTEDLVLASDSGEQQVRLVLGRLKPEELRVASAYAGRSDLTWTEAALLVGATDPVAAGERVRRKLKRLGVEHKRRLAQAGAA